MLLFGAAFLGSILYLTQFNQQVFGATASSAGVMLLPFVGGMMVSSIGSGQLASRTGHYKRFMVIGMAIASAGILSLITLQPTSPFFQEAISMVFVGLGMGMVMPLMNLAVQNEFEQHDLGSATASVQLMRGLGSTIGTAVMSGILTAGIIATIGNPDTIPYIQTLKKAPQASAIFGTSAINSDTLLAINTQKATILDGATTALQSAPIPVMAKQAQISVFTAQQDQYSKDVVNAFSDSLHHIFLIAGGLMVVGLGLIIFVKERELKSGVKATPGE
jgi:MFS family permease